MIEPRRARSAGFDLLTYRKGKKDSVPPEEFLEVEVERNGKREKWKVHDKADVPVRAVTLDRSGRTANLDLPLVPGYVYHLAVDVAGKDGAPLANRDAWYTLHAVPR